MPIIISGAAITSMLLGAVVLVVSLEASNKLSQIVATQDAVRANQQKTVFPQHEAILAMVREKCGQ